MLSAQSHAGAARAGYEAAFFIHHIAFGHAHGFSPFDDSAGGDQGCAVCDHGQSREYVPNSEVDGDTTKMQHPG